MMASFSLINCEMAQTNGLSVAEIITITISFVALLVSIAGYFITNHQAIKLQKYSLEATYFTEIFKDYLIKDIPVAKRNIVFQNERINNTEELTDTLNKLRRSALYFKYADSGFYKDFTTLLQTTEDKIVNAYNHTYEPEEQVVFLCELEEEIKKIYTLIRKRNYGV